MIGGGITGAGVALDAASRGYSVALVERDDYASGTSSRSSKMVHGGLRYLQNFDLGLVREALLERQLMVQLAPHLVYPTPFLVPTLGDDRRRPHDRDRAQHVRRDGDHAGRAGSRPASAPSARGGRATTGRPTATARSPARRRLELVPALAAARPARGLPVLRLPDRRRPPRADDPRRGRALRRRARSTAPRSPSCSTRDGRAAGRRLPSTPSPASGSRSAADNVVNATGVWADRIRPEEILDEAEVPRIAPSRGTHVTVPLDKLPLDRRRLHRPRRRGAARSSPCPGTGGR